MEFLDDLKKSRERGSSEACIYLLFGPWPVYRLKLLWYDRLALILAIIGWRVYGNQMSDIKINDYIVLCFAIFAYLYTRATVKLAFQTELLANETKELVRKK